MAVPKGEIWGEEGGEGQGESERLGENTDWNAGEVWQSRGGHRGKRAV